MLPCWIWTYRLFFGSRSADPDVITSTLADVTYRKLNYQLIPLADVDARSCVLFGHCVALICLWHWRHIKAEKGARRAFSGWRACDWSGKRLTARTLGLFSATAEELAPKAWTSAETRKKKTAKDNRRSVLPFVCTVPARGRDIEYFFLLTLFFACTRCYCCYFLIYTLF